jgi:hypothetical protein
LTGKRPCLDRSVLRDSLAAEIELEKTIAAGS